MEAEREIRLGDCVVCAGRTVDGGSEAGAAGGLGRMRWRAGGYRTGDATRFRCNCRDAGLVNRRGSQVGGTVPTCSEMPDAGSGRLVSLLGAGGEEHGTSTTEAGRTR